MFCVAVPGNCVRIKSHLLTAAIVSGHAALSKTRWGTIANELIQHYFLIVCSRETGTKWTRRGIRGSKLKQKHTYGTRHDGNQYSFVLFAFYLFMMGITNGFTN